MILRNKIIEFSFTYIHWYPCCKAHCCKTDLSNHDLCDHIPSASRSLLEKKCTLITELTTIRDCFMTAIITESVVLL